MEKIQCICRMRDLIRALSELETRLEETYGITLNEAMVLCAVGKEIVSAGDVTSRTGMTSSHASKNIRSVEDKGLLSRQLGKQDRRQMYFALTRKGRSRLERIKERGIDVPEWLAPLFAVREAAE